MDRRTLLFILGFTVIFFLINQWFDHGRLQKEAPPLTQPATEVIVEGTPSAPQLLSPAELKQLQFVKLYEDIEFLKFATYGYFQDVNFLTLAWRKDPPKVLFAKNPEETVSNVFRLYLVKPPENIGDPIIYAIYPNQKIEIPYVPTEGEYSILLLYFKGETAYKIEGFSKGTKTITIPELPSEPALILFKYQKEYYSPYAVMSPSTKKVHYLDHFPTLLASSSVTYPEDADLSEDFKKQKYFVLENEYQQLVFTNVNGALAEINLPFRSEKNPSSVVLPIGFDRTMKKDYPYSDSFPLYSYQTINEAGKIVTIENPVKGGYYPLLRRNIFDWNTTYRIPPHYYALNIHWESSPPETFLFELKRFEKNLIEFESVQGNRRIIKTFTLPENPYLAPYCFDLTVKIEGDARGLTIIPGIPEVELISGSFVPTLKYNISKNQKDFVEDIKVPKDSITFSQLTPNWICNGNGFFGIILNPLTKILPGLRVHAVPGELVPSRITIIDALYHRYPADKYPGYEMDISLPSKSTTTKFRIFAGPFDQKILQRVDETFTDLKTGRSPNYIEAKSYHGWFAFISKPFAKFLFLLMNFFYQLTHSWGISIILLTIALRIMLYPLNSWSIKSTLKMQTIGPKVADLQEKYKKDPKRSQLEIMNLYRKEGVNPFGGCLPLIIQLPFLFGMLDLLKSSFELRGASFIPGWIDNLAAPDIVFSWKYPIIFVGNSFHFLPILLGIIMYIQQKYSSMRQVQTTLTDQQKQQRTMGNIMTIVFAVLFYHFPSGLNIYWISSTLLGIVQQWWIMKRKPTKLVSTKK